MDKLYFLYRNEESLHPWLLWMIQNLDLSTKDIHNRYLSDKKNNFINLSDFPIELHESIYELDIWRHFAIKQPKLKFGVFDDGDTSYRALGFLRYIRTTKDRNKFEYECYNGYNSDWFRNFKEITDMEEINKIRDTEANK